MKLAIFSDIHANLPALEAVLPDIDALQAIPVGGAALPPSGRGLK